MPMLGTEWVLNKYLWSDYMALNCGCPLFPYSLMACIYLLTSWPREVHSCLNKRTSNPSIQPLLECQAAALSQRILTAT